MTNLLEDALSQPTFDALTISLQHPSKENARQVLDAAMRAVFGTTQAGWRVQQVHKSTPDSFDLLPPQDHAISVNAGFDLQYALRDDARVAHAEALFETTQTDIPEGALLGDGLIIAAEEGLARGSLIKINSDIDELTPTERNPMWAHEMLRTPEAWQKATGAGVRVGHPDSGYIPHAEFDNQRVRTDLEHDFYDGDSSSINRAERGGNHGLGTGSTLMSGKGKFNAAENLYVIGSAPDVEIVPMRITRKGPPVFITRSGPRRVRDAIYHAIDNGCHVISMSLGGVGDFSLRRALQSAVENNLLVLAAAGNVIKIVVWPARYPEVIAVAGCTAEREKWVHSCRGRSVEVTAPAHNVWRAYIEAGFPDADFPAVAPSSGTSYAVALVAGVACLWLEHHGRDALLAKYPDVPLQTVFRHLLTKSAAAPPPHHNDEFGSGIVDAAALLAAPLPDADNFPSGMARGASAESIGDVFDLSDQAMVRGTLANTLATEVADLEASLAGVEDELLFQILTTPTLRNALLAESTTRSTTQTFRESLAASMTLSDRLRQRLAVPEVPVAPATTSETTIETIGDKAGGTVYALLVGIDSYANPRHNLRGCINDVTGIEQFLQARVGAEIGRLSLQKLTNQHATRQNIIDAWRNHLGKATAADSVLFYYSGHGSQAPSPPEFWPFEPDKLDEGLVCWDSRTTDWDLADKELAQLISEVAAHDPHIVVILDCCHSGSGTRAVEETVGVRRLPTDTRARKLSEFIVNVERVQALNGTGGDWISLPFGRHIVLSACQADEEARELILDGRQRGVFSYYLLDSLQRTGRMLSYRELFKRVNALVRTRVQKQAPLMEATLSADLQQPFLGGLVLSGRPWFTLSHDASGWQIDGGAVHGIRVAEMNETTWLTLFPHDTPDSSLHETSRAVGQAKVISVEPARASVQLILATGQNVPQGEVYKAVVTATPLPPLEVQLEGDEAALTLVRTALANADGAGVASPYVAEAAEAALRLIATDGVYRIQRSEEAYKLVVDTDGFNEISAGLVVQRLEHIARWQTMRDLDNPASKLPSRAVQMEIVNIDGQSADQRSGLYLSYVRDSSGKWHEPRIRIRLTNLSSQPLYCSVLILSQTYGIFTTASLANQLLPPNNPPYEVDGSTAVLDDYWNNGITTFQDTFKLIVSTEAMDMTLATQDDLPVNFVRGGITRSAGNPRNNLDRLLQRVTTRHFKTSADVPIVDWMTSAITVTTLRPKADQPLNDQHATKLSERITIAPHPSLQARARLNSRDDVRSLGMHPLPAILRDDPTLSLPVQLAGDAGTRAATSVTELELFDVVDHAAVSAENPLKIHLKTDLAAGDVLLPIANDGEFYLPLGFVESAENGEVVVRLERLPEPASDGTRAITHAIRILFQKLIGQRLGFDYHYPQLAVVTVADNGTVDYNDEAGFVKLSVQSAEKILLYVHGIFDSTAMLAASAVAPGFDDALRLNDDYDLILAYDYENLHTTIEENGATLFTKLQAAGLTAGDGKRLDVIAHSMGGLVARWMIEHAGGASIVSRLMTVGTPHAGSPWPTVQDLALVGLTVALNGLTTLSPPLRALSILANGIEKFDVTLDEMKPNSTFLQTLQASPDPHVPYILVVGDTGLIRATMQEQGEKPSLLMRLLKKLRSPWLKHNAATVVAFFGEPNDMAVSVKSARAVSAERTPQPVILPSIGVDHISFFREETGLRTIVENMTA